MKITHEPAPTESTNYLVFNATSGATITPDMAATQFEMVGMTGAKALILAGTPNGTVPDYLNPLIGGLREKGVPVVILATNYANEDGPDVSIEAPYEAQVETALAGGIVLARVNINGLSDVENAITEEVNGGRRGEELRDALIDRFGVPDGLLPYIKQASSPAESNQ